MPELPELEVVRQVLERRVVGKTIAAVELVPPGGGIVVRDLTGLGFAETLTGSWFESAARRGKFLRLGIAGARNRVGGSIELVINPKLTGRLQLAAQGEKRRAKTHLVFTLDDITELRYLDQRMMGQVYLTDNVERVPDFGRMGPEPFELTRDEFQARLRSFRGEIKGILTRGELVAGIGNAYADEILWQARLHPYRRRTKMTREEIDRLYDAMLFTLRDSIERVRAAMGENIHEKPREFFAVHMRAGEPCPRCGTSISLVGANQRITNFCRTCQPGGLVRGM